MTEQKEQKLFDITFKNKDTGKEDKISVQQWIGITQQNISIHDQSFKEVKMILDNYMNCFGKLQQAIVLICERYDKINGVGGFDIEKKMGLKPLRDEINKIFEPKDKKV